MIHLICYDISDDRRRTKLADLLQREGYERIQFSVFMGRRHLRWEQSLWPHLCRLVEPGTATGDRLVVLPLPDHCLEQRQCIGTFVADVAWLLGQRHTLLVAGKS
jgi:CRISPR-associated endonuclease Cas2